MTEVILGNKYGIKVLDVERLKQFNAKFMEIYSLSTKEIKSGKAILRKNIEGFHQDFSALEMASSCFK